MPEEKNMDSMFESIINASTDAIIVADEEARILIWNPGAEKIFGYSSSEVIGKMKVDDLIHRDQISELHQAFKLAIQRKALSRRGEVIETLGRRKDGTTFLLEHTVSMMIKDDGIRFIAILRDVSAYKDTLQMLAEAEKIAHLGCWAWDIKTNKLFWSDEIYRIFGIQPRKFEATYDAFISSVHPEDRDMVIKAVEAAIYENKPYDIEHRIILIQEEQRRERIVHEKGRVTFDENGKPIRMLGAVQDVTEQKRNEYLLRKLSIAIEQSMNLIFITDSKGSIEYVNPMFETITGYTKDEVRGQNPRILASGETTIVQYANLWETIKAGKIWRGVFKNKKKSGDFYWARSMISPIVNEKGELAHFIAIQEDITDKKHAEEKNRYLSSYDITTGILNREAFMKTLEQKIEAGVLILLNIDGFRLINNSYGYKVGDEFLKRVVDLVISTGNNKELCGRIGHDEIAVWIAGINVNDGFEIAEAIRKKVELFEFTNHFIRTTLSIGIVCYPDHGETANALLSKADAAVFRARELGKNRSYIYKPTDRNIENIYTWFRQKERIVKALEDDRFEVWYQPILDLSNDQINHFEALVRMRDEDGNIILPSSFIPAAEAFGLIGAIDRIVTQKTIRFQSELRRKGKKFSFSMNLSGKEMGDNDLLTFLKSTISESNADPNSLVFEITETVAIKDLNLAVRFIETLRSIGCRFSLDDFGVGFTSFLYLKELDVDFIKIDGIFVRRLSAHKDDQGIVRAIHSLAKELEISTIAEFVEEEETIGLLKRFGVNYAQGFLIGKPKPWKEGN